MLPIPDVYNLKTNKSPISVLHNTFKHLSYIYHIITLDNICFI